MTTFIDRLEGVKQTGPGRWLARCPAHQDRSPSLSVRELADGRTLLHCFAGCGVEDVLQAVDLEFGDLFPDRLPEHSYRASRSAIPARDLLLLISHEAKVVSILAADFLDKRSFPESNWPRLAQAVERIGRARSHAR